MRAAAGLTRPTTLGPTPPGPGHTALRPKGNFDSDEWVSVGPRC